MLAIACTRVASEAPAPGVVMTKSGPVQGTIESTFRVFKGIPYAAPPVGSQRFQPPGPAPTWSAVRDASRPGKDCIQGSAGNPDNARHNDENCLTLNVWTPPADGEKRPVMVWIHGGGFVAGSGKIYDSQWMVERGDIIVVTVNYRLGSLGFLAHPALGAPGDVGNYGLEDQQAALRWVHDNIGSFGGDPEKVTVAGESAGGISVCDHLVAPGSQGLFRAAIIQSGPCQAQADLPTAERASIEYANKVGCEDMKTAGDCLRALPTDKLRRMLTYYGIGEVKLAGPITGAKSLPVDPVTAIKDGQAAKVPVLMGTNRDEFTAFLANLDHNITPEEYPAQLNESFGPETPAVESRYPLTNFPSPALAYSAAMTDRVFACSNDRVAEMLAASQPVYAYEFNDPTAPIPESLRGLPFPIGAGHSLELRYLFDTGGAPALNPAQKALSDQMIDYWAAFVKTGAPGPDWPKLRGGEGDQVMSLQLDGNRAVNTFEQTHQCPFWAGQQP